jgi:hypothetical protein
MRSLHLAAHINTLDCSLIRGEEERQWSVAEKRPRTCWSEPLWTPPKVRPAVAKLLPNGVGAGIVEREATKSRCERLEQTPLFERGEESGCIATYWFALLTYNRTTTAYDQTALLYCLALRRPSHRLLATAYHGSLVSAPDSPTNRRRLP